MLGPIVIPAVVAATAAVWWVIIRNLRFSAERRREGDRIAYEHAKAVHPSNRPMLPRDLIAADVAYREEQERLQAIADWEAQR